MQVSKLIVINTDSTIDMSTGKLLKVRLDELNSGQFLVDFCSVISFEDKLELIGNSGAIVTARLHVCMAAHFYEKPCYSV